MEHRRTSSVWIPPNPPLNNPFLAFRSPPPPTEDKRRVDSNSTFTCARYELPSYLQYAGNRISTTKYTILTFVPLNLYEQLHRFANWFFIGILFINFFHIFAAFNRFLGIIPVAIIFTATAIKDLFEDYRRYRMDKRVNESTCLVWNRDLQKFRRMHWEHLLVGDIVHISNNELLPADVLLLRSSDQQGICFVETSNLDGESALKQKHVPKCYLQHSEDPDNDFRAEIFSSPVFCMHPTRSLHEMSGFIEMPERQDNINKDHMLWRGSRLRNTTYVEGIVLYAGGDTKVMLNNGRAMAKRSNVETITNKLILLCFFILVVICFIGSVGHALWTNEQNHTKPPFLATNIAWWKGGLISLGTFIIDYQILVPLSLYITVEIIKIGLVFFMQQDKLLYHEGKDQRLQVRNLAIPEELGQITHVLSDKTGTVTENVMLFRRCAFDETDYGTSPAMQKKTHNREPSTGLRPTDELRLRVLSTWQNDPRLRHFFTNLAICNTVVVNKEHKDVLEIGHYENGIYTIDNSMFYNMTKEQFEERQEKYRRVQSERAIRFEDDKISTMPDRAPSALSDSAIDIMTSSDELEDSGSKGGGRLSRVSTFSQKISTGIQNAFKSIISSPAASIRIVGTKRRIKKKKNEKKESLYEAQSPDELALVEGAKSYGFILEERGAVHMTIQLPNKEKKRFEILRVLPFDSKRKRMSVIVRGPKGPILYTKGADSSILSRLVEDDQFTATSVYDSEDTASCSSPIYPSAMNSDKARTYLHKYACRGLRTLAYGMRQLNWEEYREFNETYEYIETVTSSDRDDLLAEQADKIEKDLTLLGVTGIEDKLQEGVADTISALREAGMQVWLLTGDKLETAENIARSCGLFDLSVPILTVNSAEDLERAEGNAERCNILLAPQVVELAKGGHAKLMETIKNSASVLCYRMTPAEKSEVVKFVKDHLQGRVLSIGDGANDVPMIQSAHVGVGLSGNEGMQAVMASDFSIARFSFLKRLLLVHGHWNYDRIANTYLYFLYKNAILVFIIFFSQFYNGFSGESPLDPIYSMLYPIIFTSVQPIVYGIYDQCSTSQHLLTSPNRYKRTMNGNCYSVKLFLLNMLDAFYQATIVYFFIHWCTWNTFTGLWEFGFCLATAMFLVNTVHLSIEVRCWTSPIIISFVFFVFFHFFFFLLYDFLVGPSWGVYGPPVLVSFRQMCKARFWAMQILSVVTALLPRLFAHVYLSVREGSGGGEINCCGVNI